MILKENNNNVWKWGLVTKWNEKWNEALSITIIQQLWWNWYQHMTQMLWELAQFGKQERVIDELPISFGPRFNPC